MEVAQNQLQSQGCRAITVSCWSFAYTTEPMFPNESKLRCV